MVDQPRYRNKTIIEVYEEIIDEYIKGNNGICSNCGLERIDCMTTCYS